MARPGVYATISAEELLELTEGGLTPEEITDLAKQGTYADTEEALEETEEKPATGNYSWLVVIGAAALAVGVMARR